MADKPKQKTDAKRAIPLRSAGEKINVAQERPSARLFAEVKRLEAEENTPKTPDSATRSPAERSQTTPAVKKEPHIAPQKDFTKFANSIVREAIPGGLFKGTSKNTYDALYQRTRGAITPARTVKAVQSDVLVWTNVSHNTLRSHLKHLQSVGLLQIHYKLGDNNGAEYEIFLPEEIGFSSEEIDALCPLLPPPTSNYQKLVPPTNQFLVVGGGGFMPENIEENASPKTFFKDNTKNDDDSARVFSEFFAKISAACERVTGKPLSSRESEKWGILADLLILELETAARHTESISSAPAFLTEVLRRKLFGGVSDRSKTRRTKPDALAQPNESGEYEIKPLGEQGREEALEQLAEFAGTEFLRDFEKWYSAEDWQWLVGKLEK